MEGKKEYQRNLQHLQAQLEMAQEQRKSLDLASVKKKLEDCEQMLQYCTQMRMKNKMKDYEVESKEWWEVVVEYFTKELEKILVQHRANERILRYKLEVYQKHFPEFICDNLISTKVLGQDEENEAAPVKQHKRKKCKLRNHKILKVEQLKRRRYNQRNHKTLKEGVRKKKSHRQFKNRKRWTFFQ